jgi:chromosome segregation ATPase
MRRNNQTLEQELARQKEASEVNATVISRLEEGLSTSETQCKTLFDEIAVLCQKIKDYEAASKNWQHQLDCANAQLDQAKSENASLIEQVAILLIALTVDHLY